MNLGTKTQQTLINRIQLLTNIDHIDEHEHYTSSTSKLYEITIPLDTRDNQMNLPPFNLRRNRKPLLQKKKKGFLHSFYLLSYMI